MMVKITCPSCETDGSFSLSDSSYDGPYRCWKCRELFAIKMTDSQLTSCEPIAQEEFDQRLAAQALRDKFKR